MRRLIMPGLMLVLAGCGVRYEQTPEPQDTERADKLIKELGVQRTYNSETLIANPDPDGLVLMRWIDRRKRTLDGTLAKYELPASDNPGTVGATLAWERETEKTENVAARKRRDACGDHPCPIEMPPDPQWSTPTNPSSTFTNG